MLSPVEDFWLRWHVEHGSLDEAERARLVLQAEGGGSPSQLAASLGLSPQTVVGALAKFEHDRLAAFPSPSLRLAQLVRLNPAHAVGRRHVAKIAWRLFNETRPLHHLPRKASQLLEAAALLGSAARPVAGNGTKPLEMELLDGATLADYAPRQQAIISCVLHLTHKGYRADRDPVFRHLRPTEQSQVRYLSALLQVAADLDHSGTQSTVLRGAALSSEAVVLQVSGPNAEGDASYACRKATLWQPVFHLTLAHAVGPRPKPAAILTAPGTANEDEPVGVVFGRRLTTALRKWQASLPGASMKDTSGLGDLLEGVIQSQGLLEAFASVLKRQPLKQVRRPLRVLTELLHTAIAGQNALSDLEAYCSGRPQMVIADLQPMHEAWERSSRRQQAALRAWLDSEAAAWLYLALVDIALAPPVRRSKATSIRVAAPVLLDELYAGVAEQEAKVVADRPETHRRYQQGLASLACALEALGGKGAMGEDAECLLADVRRLQTKIDRWLASNALNDATAEFLDAWAEQQARRKAPQLFGAQSVLAYRQARRAQWTRLRGSLPADWRPVQASKLRRRLNSLVKQLKGR